MPRISAALAVGLGSIALLAAVPAANAKQATGPKPDLLVSKVSKPPKSKLRGTKLTVVVKLRNKGARKARKTRLGLYLAKGKKHKRKDKRLKRAEVKALKAGKKGKARVKVKLPKGTMPGKYRLIACADDLHKLREETERNNCCATKRFLVTALPPAPAFQMNDGIEWGFVTDDKLNEIDAGDPVTVTTATGNAIAGQAGYARSSVGAEPLVAGSSTTLDFSPKAENNEDDGQVTVALPFAFPFGGVNQQAVSVSTNGWVSFGSPAFDYWGDFQTSDYRGVPFVVGEFERGIMPYWADLSLLDEGSGTGTVKQVAAADNSFVAFQWDTGHYNTPGTPRRVFQLVLFPDGRFRFDYPGDNPASTGPKAFVGYSLGTGPTSVDAVAIDTTTVPPSSLLFTPNPVSAELALPAGQETLTLPAGSSFASASAGCALTVAPGPFSEGQVTCPTPELGLGQQVAQTVTFNMPPNAPGETSPENFKYAATLLAGGFTLTDGKEIDALGTDLDGATKLTVKAEYDSPPLPEVGKPAKFIVEFAATDGDLDEPTLALSLPANSTFNSVEIGGQAIHCSSPAAGQQVCELPSGSDSGTAVVSVTPTSSGSLSLTATVAALNVGPVSSSVSVTP